jgi:hypothetical protein
MNTWKVSTAMNGQFTVMASSKRAARGTAEQLLEGWGYVGDRILAVESQSGNLHNTIEAIHTASREARLAIHQAEREDCESALMGLLQTALENLLQAENLAVQTKTRMDVAAGLK